MIWLLIYYCIAWKTAVDKSITKKVSLLWVFVRSSQLIIFWTYLTTKPQSYFKKYSELYIPTSNFPNYTVCMNYKNICIFYIHIPPQSDNKNVLCIKGNLISKLYIPSTLNTDVPYLLASTMDRGFQSEHWPVQNKSTSIQYSVYF